MPKRAKPEKRRRLDADAARALILDATEKRLVVAGPGGIRLQEVAADAGVSHSTVLHHFGSRELLVKAVISRSQRSLNATLVQALTTSTGDDADMQAILERVAAALEQSGHGRVILWLLLEGHPIEEQDSRLSEVVDAAHALRLSRKGRGKRPTRDDTARIVTLATLALVAGPVLTPTLLKNTGLVTESIPAFRAWVVRLLLDRFNE